MTLHDDETPAALTLVGEMRQFLVDQAQDRSADLVERYTRVADDLESFLQTVDVRPWLGIEIAEHLESRRRAGHPDDFVSILGLVSLVRVLPAFVKDPWLPPPGAQRRTHRAAARHLATFLRRRAMQDGCFQRDDFARFTKALGHSYSYDYTGAPVTRPGSTTCTVTLDLLDRLVDAVLEQVTEGTYPTFDKAIEARLNPVEVTYWREPDQSYPYGW